MLKTDYVNTKLTEIALEDIEGFPFERFCNDFMPGLVGSAFIPLGGLKDGGADALEEPLHEQQTRAAVFYQATVESDTGRKSRRTVARLREFGREPRRLILLTAAVAQHIDKIEMDLEDELDCTIAIRDRKYICSHINDTEQTRASFWQHLWPLTDHLRDLTTPTIDPPSSYAERPLVYTFLAQEASRRTSDQPVADSMVDTLILWALEGTDPDADILRTKEEILARTRQDIPALEPLFGQRLTERLKAMASKSYPGGRAIKWHRTEDAYCLPYETRRRLEDESLEDAMLKREFESSVATRASESGCPPGLVKQCVQVVIGTLQRLYEHEGIEFSAFLQRQDNTAQHGTVSDHIKAVMVDMHMRRDTKTSIGPVAIAVLRGVLYTSTEQEREYLRRVSSTYALLFTLATHPHLADFFRDLAKHFHLYVGSDVIIRALSESFLAVDDQVTKNALRIVADRGAELVLTEPVVDEVIGHLRAADFEHKNHFKTDVVPYEIARNAPHILLRAYLYARGAGSRTGLRSWEGFINAFVDYRDLHRDEGVDDIIRYLVRAFNMTYESRTVLSSLTSEQEVCSLTQSLLSDKRDPRLAENDALMPLSVYGRRKQQGESALRGEFGLETWWLTWERSILKYTKELEARERARYIMRPDFLLKFIALSPESHKVKTTYASAFTSALGFSLGRRVSPRSFHKLMDRVNESESMEPSRRSAAIAKLVDKVKSATAKEFDSPSVLAPVDRVAQATNEDRFSMED